MDGSIDVWDLLLQQNDPILTFQVCNAPIHTIQAQDQGKMLAVGARDGTTTLLGLSESLINIQNNEKKVFSEVSSKKIYIYIYLIIQFKLNLYITRKLIKKIKNNKIKIIKKK